MPMLLATKGSSMGIACRARPALRSGVDPASRHAAESQSGLNLELAEKEKKKHCPKFLYSTALILLIKVTGLRQTSSQVQAKKVPSGTDRFSLETQVISRTLALKAERRAI